MIKKYKLFATPACPNCHAVKEFLKGVEIEGDVVDATTPEGIKEVQEFKIMSAPTVLFFDENDKVVSKATTIDEIKNIVENKPLTDL
jgi:glutaredoxin-related protein